ncbi:MAG: cell division protein FtsA [Dehalococcoidia bacterium]|nr:cell division protein FtsA [Dehalococcoidia bacterium]
MLNGNLYMAIDVGSTKVCTLVAQVTSGGELEIVGTGVVPSRGMRKGLVVNIDELAQAIRASVEDAAEDVDRELPGACVGVTGGHISSLRTTATLSNLNGSDQRVITRREMELVVKHSYPKLAPGQELLHVIPTHYTVDSVHGVRNPSGLKGHQLTVDAHAVVGEAASLDNIARAVEQAGVTVRSMVLEPLASAEAVLSAEEKESGVILVDIGGGTTDVAVFRDGAMVYTAVIPVGGYQFTNDVAIALSVPYESAEIAKLRHGHAVPEMVDANESVEIKGHEGELPHLVRSRDLCRILNDRATELLRLVLLKVRDSGLQTMPSAGLVFTGGGANLAGWTDLAKEMVPGPVRIAAPKDIPGLPSELKSPAYSTSVGILLWGINHPTEQQAYPHRNGQGLFTRSRWWLHRLGQFAGSRS